MTDRQEAVANFIPPLAEVSGAYADILEHNSKNTGMGAFMLTLINSQIEDHEARQTGQTPRTSDEVIESAKTEADMQGELRDVFHGDVLARIGVRVAPLGEHVTSGEGQQVSSSALVPMVNNVELYTGFLSGMAPEEIQGDENALRLTSDIINTMRNLVVAGATVRVEDEAQKGAVQEYVEDTLRAFTAIDDEYTRLGIDNPLSYQRALEAGEPRWLNEEWQYYNQAKTFRANYDELRNYVTYWGRGVLPEYIAVGSMESLESPKTYYFDGLHDRATEDIERIVSLIGPERTTQFGREAAAAMVKGFENTLEKLDTPEGAWADLPRNRELMVNGIARLREVAGLPDKQ